MALAEHPYEAVDLRKVCVDHLWLQTQQMQEVARKGGPITMAAAEGVYLLDTEGKRYLDLMAGAGNVILGHSAEGVKQAIKEQIDRVCYVFQAAYANVPAVELSRELARITPGDLNTCFFSCNGSDANETAIKIARQYFANRGERRFKVISRSACSYQGCHTATLATSGTVGRRVMFEPLGTGFVRVPPPYCYRCYYEQTYPQCGVLCSKVIERFIQDEGPETIAAFIGDTWSVYGATPPPEYFVILREICDKHGILLICDEVVTGFGRTGKMFACNGHFNFVPDIMVVGKGLTAGYLPLSATIISDQVREAFLGAGSEHKEFNSLYTYAGIPPACAAGLATLRELQENRWVKRVAELGTKVEKRMRRLEEECLYVGTVSGMGLGWSIEVVKDKRTKEPFTPHYEVKGRINAGLLTRGLSTFMADAPPRIVLLPPFVIAEEELLGAIDQIEDVITQVGNQLSV